LGRNAPASAKEEGKNGIFLFPDPGGKDSSFAFLRRRGECQILEGGEKKDGGRISLPPIQLQRKRSPSDIIQERNNKKRQTSSALRKKILEHAV